MKMIDGLLAELEQEAQTRRSGCSSAIPQAHLSWRPHPKSMSLGQLALHVATVPGNVAELASMDTIPEPPAFIHPEAATAVGTGAGADRQRRQGETGARRLRRCEDERDVAAAERRQGHPGDAAGCACVRSDHAEPLVSPPRPAARVSAAAQPVGAVGVRPDRGRESVRGMTAQTRGVTRGAGRLDRSARGPVDARDVASPG